jgi:hypothetical protein
MPKNSHSNIYKHIETINKELGSVNSDIAEIKTDVSWLKKFQWVILGTSIGALFTGLIRLYLGI